MTKPIDRLTVRNKNRQCITANISKLGCSGNLTMEKLNKNTSDLTSWELENPSLLIFAKRYTAIKYDVNTCEKYLFEF